MADQLFATLDPTLRKLQLSAQTEVILADTSDQSWLEAHAEIIRQELNVKQVEFTQDWRYPVPLSGRILAGALGFIAVEAFLWFFVVRKGGIEARWAAALMGVYFLICLLIISAWASLGTRTEAWIVVFFLYCAASHLGYGIFGSRARTG